MSTPSNPATGIELKLENGNVIKADNPEEALKVAAKMIEDNSRAYRETKASLESVQSQMQTLQQQIEQQRKPVDTNAFNRDNYYKLLNEDPIEAQNYLDAHRFGIDSPENVPRRFNEMYEKISVLDGQTLAASFTNNHPEFPSDPESAKALTDRIKVLQMQGHPTDMHTMDIAWNQLVAEGAVKPLEQQQEPEALPPSLGGSGAVLSDTEVQKIDQMDTKQLEAYLKSKGML